MTPTDILELLRAAASLGSLLINLGYRGDTQRGAQAVSEHIAPSHRALLTSASGAHLLDALVIDEGLLGDLTQQIARVQMQYRRALNAAATPEERRRADRWAEREVCEHLHRIRMRNGGELPLGELQDVWRSYGCASAHASAPRVLAE